ncbi:phospholipid scramblase 2-like [Spea bombifrons]|uniref:phospholipid scramblase 2-like n=1 Tax=Spea bombifrons TaxID=233779 RepID=UPI0023493CE3|nr:phospholipid scramblase 2-like [Spea bombifrons]
MTDLADLQSKPTQDVPPSYQTIAPYAPPDSYPPTAPPADSGQLKGVPPGLEYLTQINYLTVKEKFKTSQGWGRSFEILNSNGQRVFQADESVRCCGPLYDVKILDNGGNGVMDLTENCACACTREMKVCDISGEILAFVTLHWNNMVTHLSVKNSAQNVVLMIIGPGFRTNIFGNVSFEVKSHDEQHVVGMIKNENEQFVVSFPLDLEVTIKAALLGSCLYLDSLIYKKRSQLERRARHARH